MKKILLALLLFPMLSIAQRPSLTPPVVRFSDSNGKPLVFGKLYSYQAGTTTPLATYVDSTTGALNTNPVILDSTGSASVFLGTNVYKFILQNSSGVVQWTADNIAESGFQSSFVNSVFGRTGTVVATNGDYNCSQITGAICDLPNLYNQTIQVSGAALAQEPILNLIPGIAGGISKFTITAGGSGYVGAPTVTFTGGTCATEPTGSAVVASGMVTSGVIVTPGAGCISAPTPNFSGGGGTGAAGTSTLYTLGVVCVDNPTETSTDCTFTGAGDGGTGGTSTVTDVTFARAFGTVYQNTNTVPLLVTVTGTRGGDGCTENPFIGVTSTPSIPYGPQSATPGTSAPASGSTTFLVPASQYYEVTTDFCSLNRWIEATLPGGGGGGGTPAGPTGAVQLNAGSGLFGGSGALISPSTGSITGSGNANFFDVNASDGVNVTANTTAGYTGGLWQNLACANGSGSELLFNNGNLELGLAIRSNSSCNTGQDQNSSSANAIFSTGSSVLWIGNEFPSQLHFYRSHVNAGDPADDVLLFNEGVITWPDLFASEGPGLLMLSPTTGNMNITAFPSSGIVNSNGSAFTVATSSQLVTALNASPSTTLAPALLSLGSASAFGAVKVDGTTITASGGVISAPGGGSMVYPGAGIAVSTGSAWTTSLTAPSGIIVGTTDTQTLTNKSLSFDQITSGTNLSHGLVCGAGCVMSASGGGFINANEINGTLMSGLATGILKNTTSTGVPSIAVASDFPTLNQSTTGNAATATTSNALQSATTTVNVSSATAPTTGQVLTATSGTAATWQTPSGGSSAFSSLTSGTNTTAAMLVGSGASLAATGTGIITATAVPVTGITGLGTGVGTFLGTPASANLAAALTDETGSGVAVFGTGPTISQPLIMGASGSSVSCTNPIVSFGIAGTPYGCFYRNSGTNVGHFAGENGLALWTFDNPLTSAGTITSALGTAAITSATGATGVTSVTCATANCTVYGGTYTVVGGTATTGTFVTLVWPTTTTAWRCEANMNGGGSPSVGFLGIGHSVATATGMTLSAAVTILSTTFSFDYSCQP